MTPNTTYYARLRSNNHAGSANAFVSASTATTSDTPGGPTFSAWTTTSLTVNWTDGANPVGKATYTYELHGDAAYTSLVSSKTALGTLTSGAINGLTPNTTYYARVRSSNHSGTFNAFVSATSATIAEDPPSPTFPPPLATSFFGGSFFSSGTASP